MDTPATPLQYIYNSLELVMSMVIASFCGKHCAEKRQHYIKRVAYVMQFYELLNLVSADH